MNTTQNQDVRNVWRMIRMLQFFREKLTKTYGIKISPFSDFAEYTSYGMEIFRW